MLPNAFTGLTTLSDFDFSSPFLTEDIDNTNSDYWLARRELAAAMRELIEATTVSDLPPDAATALAAEARSLVTRAREHRSLLGVIEYGKAHGSFAMANHEILCVGGASHPMAPGLEHWIDGDTIKGRVSFNWSYEGPPMHAHGGWVAAIFDHFMGMAHMRSGAPGMTASLTVNYLRPTPLNTPLDLQASVSPVDERKTQVSAEMHCQGDAIAKATALFIKPKHTVFSSALGGATEQ